jgi:hypothetical protein
MLYLFVKRATTLLLITASLSLSGGIARSTEGSNKADEAVFLQLDKLETVTAPAATAKRGDWFYKTLEVNYVLLNAADLITTFKSLDKGAREVNPIARSFITNKPLATSVKACVTAGVLLSLSKVKRENATAACVTLGVLNLLYGIVVTNNIGVYVQMN